MKKKQQPQPLRWVLAGGILLRCVVFIFLDPINSDGHAHLQHATLIRDHQRIPLAAVGDETWQPPLYYVVTAGLMTVSDDPKFLQGFSLCTSIAALFIALKLIQSGAVVATRSGQLFAALLIAFLPQFVMFGLYISNDSLAVFLGFLSFYTLVLLQKQPTTGRFVACAGALCCGMLTKGQFLVIGAAVFPVALFYYWKPRWNRPGAAAAVSGLALLLLAIGCFKYVQNARAYGHPFLMNLDFHPYWAKVQQGTYRSLPEAISLNIAGLIGDPFWTKSTSHSVTTMLYGTFWYQYIPESNFLGDVMSGPKWIGRYMDVIGIFPLMLLGVGVITVPLIYRSARETKAVAAIQLAAIVTYVGNLFMMLFQFAKFDVWSIIQARSLFPTLFGALVLTELGIIALQKVFTEAKMDRYMMWWDIAFVTGALIYFATEISLISMGIHPT